MSLKIFKYINDPVYAAIPLTELEWKLINTKIFQRLRHIKQLANVNYVFPGAEHSRFVHSLGVLYIMGLMTQHLLDNGYIDELVSIKMRTAALLHDIGHYPLSHLGENAYSYIEDKNNATKLLGEVIIPLENKFPFEFEKEYLFQLASSHSKSANHEALGEYIIAENKEIKDILKAHGLDPSEIGRIFTGKSEKFFYSQLVHSSLDADRLDYLLRDSFQTGVNYGLVDFQYLIRLLMIKKDEQQLNEVLVCNKKGQHVVEHFLMSRYFHYSQVIFHKTNAAFEGLIKSIYIKLLQNKGFIYNSFDEIKTNVNTDTFFNFNDANLHIAFQNYYGNTSDEEYKTLYDMYTERKRPKVIFDIKSLYDETPHSEFSALKWILKKMPSKISEITGNEKWGYQIAPVTVEKIHSHYPLTEPKEEHAEDLREAVRLYDAESKNITYLAEDKFSVINKLSNYRSEFIRIFILDNSDKYNYAEIHKKINYLIK